MSRSEAVVIALFLSVASAGCVADADDDSVEGISTSQDELKIYKNLIVSGEFDDGDNFVAPSRVSPTNPRGQWHVDTTSLSNGGGDFAFPRHGDHGRVLAVTGGPAVGLEIGQVVPIIATHPYYALEFKGGRPNEGDTDMTVTVTWVNADREIMRNFFNEPRRKVVKVKSTGFPARHSVLVSPPRAAAYAIVTIHANPNSPRTLFEDMRFGRQVLSQ